MHTNVKIYQTGQDRLLYICSINHLFRKKKTHTHTLRVALNKNFCYILQYANSEGGQGGCGVCVGGGDSGGGFGGGLALRKPKPLSFCIFILVHKEKGALRRARCDSGGNDMIIDGFHLEVVQQLSCHQFKCSS